MTRKRFYYLKSNCKRRPNSTQISNSHSSELSKLLYDPSLIDRLILFAGSGDKVTQFTRRVFQGHSMTNGLQQILAWILGTVLDEITRQHPIGGIFTLHRSTPYTRIAVYRLNANRIRIPHPLWDKYSPNSVSCRIGFSSLYTSIWGQTGQLQDQWPWWQRTFLGRVNPKSHGVRACLRPSDPRSP